MKIINKNDQTDLDKIILILASKYHIDRIFLNTYYAVDVPFYELVILLSNKEHKSVYNGGCGIDNSDEVSIRVFLYNQAIEQACLGLLEYFYGYKPYNHNLKHLYSLCSSFWTFPNDIFPSATNEDKELFEELTKSVNNTRYLGWAAFDWDEAHRYESKCRRFLKNCSDLVRVW